MPSEGSERRVRGFELRVTTSSALVTPEVHAAGTVELLAARASGTAWVAAEPPGRRAGGYNLNEPTSRAFTSPYA